MIINDLIQGVSKKLRDRDDLNDDIPVYIKKAILDITQNYEFEELRTIGPLTNFIINQAVYPKEGSSCPFIIEADRKITFIVSWFCYFTDVITAGQSTGFEIKQRNIRVVEPRSKILGLPTICTIMGSNIIVGFMPDKAYATQLTYQKQHPFNPANTLAGSQIYMPDDWQDIIEYAAAEKACDDVGMTDVGVLYHQKIFGNQKKQMPGLIMERLSQQDRNVTYNERQLRPVVRRYT